MWSFYAITIDDHDNDAAADDYDDKECDDNHDGNNSIIYTVGRIRRLASMFLFIALIKRKSENQTYISNLKDLWYPVIINERACNGVYRIP